MPAALRHSGRPLRLEPLFAALDGRGVDGLKIPLAGHGLEPRDGDNRGIRQAHLGVIPDGRLTRLGKSSVFIG